MLLVSPIILKKKPLLNMLRGLSKFNYLKQKMDMLHFYFLSLTLFSIFLKKTNLKNNPIQLLKDNLNAVHSQKTINSHI